MNHAVTASRMPPISPGDDRALRLYALVLVAVLMAALAGGCTRLSAPPADPAAEAAVNRLKTRNLTLTRFKALGRLTIGDSGSVQSYRIAMAGRLPDNVRIDLLAPIGGAAASVASDGRHLFVVRHVPTEYHRWRAGNGSLRRFIGVSMAVADLLELLVGRVPLAADRFARLAPVDNDASLHLALADRRGRVRERITLDETGRPVSAEWRDSDGDTTMMLRLTGQRVVDAFSLPRQIDLTGPSGQRVAVTIDRFMANTEIDDTLFVLKPPEP